MATSPGRNLPDVVRKIYESAASHDFTQVAYLLEKSWPERGKIGDGLDRWCHFRPATETSFPAADIRRCRYDDHGRLDIQLNFMGFYGVDAALPHYFTDRAMLDDNGGLALRAFLDIFNHRLYTLYYQAWKKYRPTFHIDEPSNLYLRMISAFSGWTIKEYQGAELAYAGLLGRRIKNSQALENLLKDYLETMPVSIRQFQPRWVRIKNDNQLVNDRMRLGDNVVLGNMVLDRSAKIDIEIGPITPNVSMCLMPSTYNGQTLLNLISRYLPPSIDFDLVILITSGEVSAEPLGSNQLVLGWSTWLQEEVIADWKVRINGDRSGKFEIQRTKVA